MPWVTLCIFDELTDGRGMYVEIDGFRLAVFRTGDTVSAIDNTCPHAGANLSDGYVEDGCAVCPYHFWAFRLDNGQLQGSPGVAVSKYPTRLLDRDQKRFVQADLPRF